MKMTKSRKQSSHSGGRKTATACVQLVDLKTASISQKENGHPETYGAGATLVVNGKPAAQYFQNNQAYLQNLIAATDLIKAETQYEAHVSVQGGGLSAQAQAVRLALSKAFATMFPEFRTSFKKPGFLTRDARIKERRKYGLKKARKAPQFSKR